MDQLRFQELKNQGLSREEIFSLATKEDLIENLKSHAQFTQASDEKINNETDRESKRIQSYKETKNIDKNNDPKEKLNKIQGIRKLMNLISGLDAKHANYTQEQARYSEKARAVAEKIEYESEGKVHCVIDKEFIDTFGKTLGATYRGSALLGNRVIARDEKALEDEGLMRHEAIHCMQQRDLNNGKAGLAGFIKRLGYSGMSYISLLRELRGSPEAASYATQNQISERETYANQLDSSYLQNRKPRAWLQANTPRGRKAIVKAYMKKEAAGYTQKIDDLTQQYEKETDMYKRIHVAQEIADLKKFFVLQEKLDPEDWKYFIILKDEIPEHLQQDPSYQIKFETKDNRDQRQKLQKEGDKE